MSLSSQRAVKETAIMASDQPAIPRRVRPRVKTSAPCGSFGDPDLLERRPVVGRPFRPKEPPPVGRLEADVHLQSAVVRAAAVRPAAFVAMDAKELLQMRWPLSLAMCDCGPPLPEVDGSLHVLDAHLREHAPLGRRPRDAHEVLPAPGRALVGVDLP